MKKILVIFFLMMLVPSIVSATVNLDFRLDVEEKGFYPNEKVPLDVTVVNRDSTFTAGDAELTVYISDRFYTFDLGDLKPGETFEEKITLPEFPPATHTIKGEINYTGILDERFIKTTYGSFEVLFPPIERYPRNVYVSNYDLPEKIIGGKDYDVGITIINDGEVSANLLIEFGSLDEFFTEETTLNSGESTTVKMNVKFENSGVSLIEARVYTVINGEKYLLNYRGKKTYVQGERKAKLIFDKIEFVDEADNKINQEDIVKFRIFLKNEGETATNVMGELLSTIGEINILDKIVSYLTILKKDSVAPSEDIFEIETSDIEAGDYELNLKLTYADSEDREKEIKIPITISEGGDSCYKDTDCSEAETCKNNQCIKVECVDGYVKDRECIKYECVRDSQCSEFQACNSQIHKCVEKTGCIKIVDNGHSNDKADFLFIGAEFSNPEELKETISELLDLKGDTKYPGLFSVEPFKSNKDKFNIWMIKAPDYSVSDSTSCSNSCGKVVDFSQDSIYASQCPNADFTITIFKEANFRSCAGGGQWSSLSCQEPYSRGRLILHETGHSFGRLADEYVEPSKGSRPWGPNCADTLTDAQQMWGDLVGIGKVDFFKGCSYTDDNYRATKNSLMRSHYSATTYGPVNERAIKKIIEKYK